MYFLYFLREVVLGSSVGHASLVVDIGSGMCWMVLLVMIRDVLCGYGVSHVLQHGEVYTVDASSAWTARAHRTADRHLAAVSGLHEKSQGWVSAQALAHVN